MQKHDPLWALNIAEKPPGSTSFNDSQCQAANEDRWRKLKRTKYERNNEDIEYSSDKGLLTFYLGGSKFDVSVAAIKADGNEFKASYCNHLGGQTMDNRMLKYMMKEFNRTNSKDMSGDVEAIGRLKSSCERAKRALSSASETSIEIKSLFEGIDFFSSISRTTFEKLNMGIFQKCMELVGKCLEDAKIRSSNVDEVVLEGGASRILMVQQMLQKLLGGTDVWKAINPVEAVDHGAAVQAANLSGEGNKRVLKLIRLDLAPVPLDIAAAPASFNDSQS